MSHVVDVFPIFTDFRIKGFDIFKVFEMKSVWCFQEPQVLVDEAFVCGSPLQRLSGLQHRW